MKPVDRRSVLKFFGLSAAAIPVLGDSGETEFETLSHDQPGTERPVRGYIPLGDPKHWHIRHSYMYSSVSIGRRLQPEGSRLEMPGGKRFDARIPDARSMYDLFSYGAGEVDFMGNDTTIADTNMCVARRLDMPEAYAVSRVGILFSPTTSPDVRRSFAERYNASLWISQRRYWESPVAAIFGVGEIDNVDRPALGFATLDIPVIVPSQCSFYMTLNGIADPSDELKLWGMLGNLYAQGIG